MALELGEGGEDVVGARWTGGARANEDAAKSVSIVLMYSFIFLNHIGMVFQFQNDLAGVTSNCLLCNKQPQITN